ncbi:MAG: OsmC family protein [Desulfovibrio sp.]
MNLDASAMYGGTDTAPSPMDLLIIGLSGCTGIVMTIAMEQLGIELDSLEVFANGDRAEQDPGEYSKMCVQFDARGNGITHEIMQKAIIEFVIPKAPVLCTLGKSCTICIGYLLDGNAYQYIPESNSFSELKN